MGIFSNKRAKIEIEKRQSTAEKLLDDSSKLSKFLSAVSGKFIQFKDVKNTLSKLPLMVELVRSYSKKEYTRLPKRTVVAIVAALIYFLSPVDVIPDFIPELGKLDDIIVINYCLKLVEKDLNDYVAWKNQQAYLK